MVVVSADYGYRMGARQIIDQHLATSAGVPVGYLARLVDLTAHCQGPAGAVAHRPWDALAVEGRAAR